MSRSARIVAVVATALALVAASFAAKGWLAPATPSLTQPSVGAPTEPQQSASHDEEQLLPTVEPNVESVPRPRASPPRGPRSPRFGRVIDAQNGVPISGARVGRPQPAPGGLLDRDIWSLQRLDDTTACDDAGRFEYALADGEWLVGAAEGYAALPIAAMRLGATREASGAVQLVRPARLRATVEFDEGPAVEGVAVRVIDCIEGARFVVEGTTDAHGEALLTGIAPARELQIEIADGFALLARDPVTTEFKSGGGIVKTWRLPPPPIVSGRVVDQHGDPVSGAGVSGWPVSEAAFDPSTEAQYAREIEETWGAARWGGSALSADDDGRFLLGSRNPGIVSIRVAAREQDDREHCHSASVAYATIRAGERSRWLDVEVDRGLVIRGRLVAPDGTPRECDLRACFAEDRGALYGLVSFRSDEEGRFELRGVSRHCKATLLATSVDGTLATRLPVVVRTVADEQLLALMPAQSLVVALRTEEGESTRPSRLLFFRASDGSLAMPCIDEFDDASRFRHRTEIRVVGLAPGSYDLVVEERAELAIMRGVVVEESGEQRLEPRLEPTGTIVVPAAREWREDDDRAVEAGWPRPLHGNLRVRVAGLLLVDESFRRGDNHSWEVSHFAVPPGPVTVERTVDGQRSTETFTIAVGEKREVRVPAKKPASADDEE
jgi:hypothetical protein